MNRRNFLAGLGALVGGLAINEAIPLGRVWSFPTEIKPRTLQFDPNPFAITGLDHSTFRAGDLITIGNDPVVYIVVGNKQGTLMAYPSTPDTGKAYQYGLIPEKLARRFPFQRSGEVGSLFGFDSP